MSAFLWTMAIVSGINTLCCLIRRCQDPMTVGVRICDAILTACIGVWAVVLLAQGVCS